MSRIDDPRLDRYFTEVGKYPLPTEAEEKALFTQYQKIRITYLREPSRYNHKKLRDITQKIACGYLRFVILNARRRTRDNVLFSDLISEGNIGLLYAIQKFDVNRGVRFLTYAASWIVVKMQEALHKLKDVNIQSHTRKEAKKNKEELPEIHFSSIENVVLTDYSSVKFNEINALDFINSIELSQLERFIVIYSFGLRGSVKRPDTIRQMIYDLDGTPLCSKTYAEHLSNALFKLRKHLKNKNITSANDFFDP